jgi:serine/threonine-protein kinase
MAQYQSEVRQQLQHVSSNNTIASDGGANATSTPSSSPLTGIQIAYPNEWLVNDLGNGTIRFSSPLRTDLMRFTVNVVDLPSSMKNMSLDNVVDLNLNTSRQQLSNFSLIESNATTISLENQSAHKIVYTNTNKDPNFPLKFKTMQIFTIKDGQLYTLSYVSEDSQYLRYLPTIENMINSVTFTKDTGLQTTGNIDLMSDPNIMRI